MQSNCQRGTLVIACPSLFTISMLNRSNGCGVIFSLLCLPRCLLLATAAFLLVSFSAFLLFNNQVIDAIAINILPMCDSRRALNEHHGHQEADQP